MKPIRPLRSLSSKRPIDIGANGAVYGSTAGQTGTVNGNGGFHCDKALGSWKTYTPTGSSRYSWREVAF